MPSSYIDDNKAAGVFRVNRVAMTSPAVLEQEWTQVFSRNWVYVGHESEIERPGDFRRRNVGGRPLMFVRGSDGVARAFYNTCPHRGAIICRHDEGNQAVFQCFYHAWSFSDTGKLLGLPDESGYSDAFAKEEMGLTPVPRMESYRGFCFVSFDPDIVDLKAYLADAAEYLDLVADQSLDGRMKVIKGTHRYSIRANWKLLVENSIDGYHAVPTHQTYMQYLQGVGGVAPGGFAVGVGKPLGNGHACIEYSAPWGRPVARWAPTLGEQAQGEIAAIQREMVERYGEERGRRITEINRNIFIYPNLIINDIMAVTIRTFNPVQPDLMEVTAYELAPAEETGPRLERRLHNFLEFLGPGGFATPDDVEALESCQIGFRADGVAWSDISRGMHRDANPTDEAQMRAFWRQWNAQMTGAPVSDWSDGPKGAPTPVGAGTGDD